MVVVTMLFGVGVVATMNSAVASVSSGSWQTLTNLPNAIRSPGAMFLLTDGRVLMQDYGQCNCGSNTWWILTPDQKGSYAQGTWTQAASSASNFGPQYDASAVLPDGRVIVEGDNYNFGAQPFGNQGAI